MHPILPSDLSIGVGALHRSRCRYARHPRFDRRTPLTGSSRTRRPGRPLRRSGPCCSDAVHRLGHARPGRTPCCARRASGGRWPPHSAAGWVDRASATADRLHGLQLARGAVSAGASGDLADAGTRRRLRGEHLRTLRSPRRCAKSCSDLGPAFARSPGPEDALAAFESAPSGLCAQITCSGSVRSTRIWGSFSGEHRRTIDSQLERHAGRTRAVRPWPARPHEG